MRKDSERETQIIEGKEHVIIHSDRYKIPLAIPRGIYDIMERIARNSVLSPEQRQAARERGQKNLEMLRKAREDDAKLTPEARHKRDEKQREEKDKESLNQQEETLKAIGKLRANEEATRRKYEERFGPPTVLKPLDESNPNVQSFRKEMDDLFGPLDEQG